MKQYEFKDKLNTLKNKLGVWHVGIGEKVSDQFTLGYYLDSLSGKFIVYEVDERQIVSEWGTFDKESEALDDLYELIKYRLWID